MKGRKLESASHQDTYVVSFEFDSERQPPLHLVVERGGFRRVVDFPLKGSDPECYTPPRVSLSGGTHASEGDELVEVAKKFQAELGKSTWFTLHPGEINQVSLNTQTGRRTEVSGAPMMVVRFIRDEVARQMAKLKSSLAAQ